MAMLGQCSASTLVLLRASKQARSMLRTISTSSEVSASGAVWSLVGVSDRPLGGAASSGAGFRQRISGRVSRFISCSWMEPRTLQR